MEEAVTAKWRFMGKKKKKWRAGGRCDASGQPRTNQCTLPLWSIHASPDYSRGTQISDPRATPVIIFLTQISAKQQLRPPPSQRTSSSPANHSDCRWQTPSAHRRGMSVIFLSCPSSPEPNNVATVHANARDPYTVAGSCTTDQLCCCIPNRTYPINLPHTGIED